MTFLSDTEPTWERRLGSPVASGWVDRFARRHRWIWALTWLVVAAPVGLFGLLLLTIGTCHDTTSMWCGGPFGPDLAFFYAAGLVVMTAVGALAATAFTRRTRPVIVTAALVGGFFTILVLLYDGPEIFGLFF